MEQIKKIFYLFTIGILAKSSKFFQEKITPRNNQNSNKIL